MNFILLSYLFSLEMTKLRLIFFDMQFDLTASKRSEEAPSLVEYREAIADGDTVEI